MLPDEVAQGHSSTKLQIDTEAKCIKYLNSIVVIITKFSVFNDRTSIYKNSQFDYVLDQTSTQRKLYDRAQIGDMVKASVDVSTQYYRYIFPGIPCNYICIWSNWFRQNLHYGGLQVQS